MLLNEETEKQLAEMLEVLNEHGYVLEGEMEAFDPEKFLHAVLEAIEGDSDFSYATGSWLKERAETLLGLTEDSEDSSSSDYYGWQS